MNATLDVCSVRRASGPADWAQASALLHDYVEWIRTAARFDPFAEQPALASELDDLAGHYSDPDRTLLIAFLGDVAVGTIALRCRPGGGAELKRMYVRPDARGLGIADALIEEAIDRAVAHGCDHVWLESVRGVMEPAIAVYQRHGFSFAERADPTMDIPGLVVMQRLLGAPAVNSITFVGARFDVRSGAGHGRG